jgi:hypothetical protein
MPFAGPVHLKTLRTKAAANRIRDAIVVFDQQNERWGRGHCSQNLFRETILDPTQAVLFNPKD